MVHLLKQFTVIQSHKVVYHIHSDLFILFCKRWSWVRQLLVFLRKGCWKSHNSSKNTINAWLLIIYKTEGNSTTNSSVLMKQTIMAHRRVIQHWNCGSIETFKIVPSKYLSIVNANRTPVKVIKNKKSYKNMWNALRQLQETPLVSSHRTKSMIPIQSSLLSSLITKFPWC